MKKICLVAIILSIALLTGCSNKKKKCIPCSSRASVEQVLEIDLV